TIVLVAREILYEEVDVLVLGGRKVECSGCRNDLAPDRFRCIGQPLERRLRRTRIRIRAARDHRDGAGGQAGSSYRAPVLPECRGDAARRLPDTVLAVTLALLRRAIRRRGVILLTTPFRRVPAPLLHRTSSGCNSLLHQRLQASFRRSGDLYLQQHGLAAAATGDRFRLSQATSRRHLDLAAAARAGPVEKRQRIPLDPAAARDDAATNECGTRPGDVRRDDCCDWRETEADACRQECARHAPGEGPLEQLDLRRSGFRAETGESGGWCKADRFCSAH